MSYVQVLFIFIIVILNNAQSQLSSYFTNHDVNNIKSQALSIVEQSKSLKDLYYAINHLKLTGLTDISCNCGAIKNSLSAINTSGYDIYYGISINNICKCDKISTDFKPIANKSIQSDDLISITGGILAMTVLGKVSNEDKISSMSKLAMLMTKEGKFKMNPYDDDSMATIKNLHYALEMLSAITSDNDMSDFATDVFEKAFGLIPNGTGTNDQETDVLLMVVLSKLTNKKLRLVGNRLVFISEILISLKYSNDIETLAKVYEAFHIISTYKASPVYMSIQNTSFKYLDTINHKLQFKVQDVFGVDIESDYVEVVSIKNVGKDTMLFQGSKLQNNILDMSSASLIPGRYIVQLSAQLSGRPKPNTYQSYFVVNDQVTINNVSIGVSSDNNEPHNMNILKAQNSILDLDAVAANNDRLFIKFDIVSILQSEMTKKPHQALVRLTNEQSGHAAYFTAKKLTSVGDALQYSSTINLSAEVDKFTYISGEYALSLLIGDSAYDSPHEWIVGTIQLTFPTKTNVHKPLYKESLLHTSDNTLEPLPEISHVMRSPAKRASNLMATIFTVFTWLPLVIYVLFVLSLQLNLSYLASIPNLLLFGCFSMILLLYVSYWLALDGVSFYDTIRYLCFLCPITIIVGNYALNLLTQKRLLKETKEVKAK